MPQDNLDLKETSPDGEIAARRAVPITVTCSQCQHSLNVKDELAGKRGKCPKCQAVVQVPAASAAPAASSKPAAPATQKSTAILASLAETPPAPPVLVRPSPTGRPGTSRPPLKAQIFSGFRADAIEPVTTTWLYQVGILLTTVLMVLLPLIYVGIIGLVAWLVWLHMTNSYVIIGAAGGGKATLMALVVYLAPLVIGVIVVVFMFKPLFAQPAKEGRRRSATPQSDPLLFEFVERICGLVGAAKPRRIDIDCEINASASFRRGWLSLITGRDLVLTIGMPLAAGLSLQQFAGVLAHEFGHFSQGAGMRLTYVIRSINFWFMRVVYERDSWDDWLKATSESVDIRVGWIIFVARACVWLTRKILWLLMYVGHLVAGFMLRQMEFDADKYEARVAGSDAFAATSEQLKVLGLAWRSAEHDLASYHREGRMVDNMPRLLMSNMEQLPKEAYELVHKMTAETETGWFDSHPADKDRIVSARAEQAPGVFHSDLPASVLFGNFDASAKGVTWDFYCSIFGPTLDPKTLFPTDVLLARSAGEQTAAKARERFFIDAFTLLRPLRLPVMQGQNSQPSSVWQAELKEARETMASRATVQRESIAAYDKADTRLVQSRQARSVLSTGVKLQAGHFEMAYLSAVDASWRRDQAQSDIGRLGSSLDAFDEASGRRLRADLMLLFESTTASRIDGAESMQREARQLVPIAAQISTLHGSILELRNQNATLVALLGHVGGNEQNESLIREILDLAKRVRYQLSELRNAFERVDYPFDHAAGQISVAQYLVKIIPPEDEVGSIYEAADEAINKLLEMYVRAISRLCITAEAVETVQGYEPLPSAAAAAGA